MRRVLVLICMLAGTPLGCDADGGVDPIVAGPEHRAGGAAGAGAAGALGGASPAGDGGSSPAGGAAGTTAAAGAAGSSGEPSGQCRLTPSQNGWVSAASNPCGLQGAWFVLTDCATAGPDCAQISYPPAGGFTSVAGNACVQGTTAAWTSPDESTDKWGAGIGLGLNEQTDPAAKQPIGDLELPFRGFRFKLSGQAPGLYVAFPVLEVDPQPHLIELWNPAEGEYTVYFEDARQDEWVQNPTPLAWQEIRMIQFHIRSQNVPVTFSFCINELTALY